MPAQYQYVMSAVYQYMTSDKCQYLREAKHQYLTAAKRQYVTTSEHKQLMSRWHQLLMSRWHLQLSATVSYRCHLDITSWYLTLVSDLSLTSAAYIVLLLPSIIESVSIGDICMQSMPTSCQQIASLWIAAIQTSSFDADPASLIPLKLDNITQWK